MCALPKCANYFWHVGIYIILPEMGFPTPSFEIRRSDESRQYETGSESEDTGSPREGILDNVQTRNIGTDIAQER